MKRGLSFLLPTVICAVGISIYGVAQDSAVITGDAKPSPKAPAAAAPANDLATVPLVESLVARRAAAAPANDLATVPLVESLVARRAAAMDAAERALDAEVEEFLAERTRETKELKDWLAKEREKLTGAPPTTTAKRK